MTFKLLMAGGVVAMIAMMCFTGRYYQLPVWKRILLGLASTGAGLLGTKILSWIESGNFNGRSFFGVVFFAPIMLMLFAWIIRMKIPDMLDMCAPAECLILAFMKVNCIISDCCIGMVLYQTKYGKDIRFPSQIVECLTAVLLMVVLMFMLIKKIGRGKLYAWYMILYGIVRFALNLLRETKPFVWILPAGNFWSLISIIIGVIIIVAGNKISDKIHHMFEGSAVA